MRPTIASARRVASGLLTLGVALSASPLTAQNPVRSRPPMDPERAAELYVSNRPEDHPESDYQGAIERKARTDSIFRAHAAGAYDFSKVTYRSSAPDGLEIPASVFQPLQKRGARGHAAMVWVHGGVHGNWTELYLPFIKEAVARGYVIIAPDYRGSTGYGKAFHEEIDYGGYEVDDVVAAYGYLAANLPHVDTQRVGMMGWSHGGFITSHALFREEHPFQAGAAMVPVSNLIFRLSLKGPGYQRSFSTQKRVQGLPFEKPEEYIARSPVYHVKNLDVPMLVHVATNDLDVNFVEDVQMVWALEATKPDLAETKIYEDPAGWGGSVGHAFNRRVDPETLERVDSPAQIDSWNRVWTFFDWNLQPDEDPSKPAPTLRTR